ncbi:TetR/AcrR family transcriptional regulator [Mumia sp. ZJ1417]|uniref:TetR/AcrR family transcriptional regulator n=1 Tax=Mumia sp. ZJ1417 TaxID=2708082 RepID=UPI00141E16CB|nr:TetR/AcrR family transcriptional regulator [Mumia sp. ZJ1417]QMW66897.1 TetR/AcrR family transcriptional regulator [Mumia sp. ZJ1417]
MPARRDALMDELISLFLAEGFLSFGIGDLAARLRCSRTTLYAIAPSKEQIIAAAVRAFFRGATEHVEASLAEESDPVARLRTYLEAISCELAPASPAFFADVDAFAPARDVYRRNTEWAARRVRQLVADLGPQGSGVDPAFAGVVAAQVMLSIQSGELEAQTGVDDATAYHQLASLLVAGVSPARPSTARPGRSA